MTDQKCSNGAAVVGVLLLGCLLFATAVSASDEVLELFVGTWDAKVTTLEPVRAEVTYRETYEWVLGGKFLEGKTSNKSDGTTDISLGTYDAEARGYPYWIFSSSGSYLYLAPGKWNARERTLEWKNPANSDLYYETRVVFTEPGRRRWTVLVKDWRGNVLARQEGSAVRRSD